MGVHAAGEGLALVLGEVVGRHGDDGDGAGVGAIHRADSPGGVVAVHYGHLHVHEDHVEGARGAHPELRHGLLAVGRHLAGGIVDVQDGGDDLRVQGVVLRHEDVLVRQGVPAGPAGVAGSLSVAALAAVRLVAGRREVQIDDEGAARPQLAFYGDGASHKIDEVLRDGHAEARSLNLVGEARLLAGERVEDGGEVVLRHADAVVADDYAQMLQLSMALGGAVDAEEDVAALGRVLHGVGEQVHEDLAQPPLVADEPIMLDLVHFHGKHLVFGVGRWRIMASTDSTVPERAKALAARVVLPASIFDMSSTSLMSPKRCWPEVAILRL